MYEVSRIYYKNDEFDKARKIIYVIDLNPLLRK